MFFQMRVWSGRRYYLDKMSLRDLIWAYVTYPGIQAYMLLIVLGVAATAYLSDKLVPVLIAAMVTGLAYPLIWYVLHRFVLHGRFLYKIPATAAVWKRIHFDHHQDPNDLSVLFGALYTTVPTIVIFTGPIGWLIGGMSAAVAAVTMGVFATGCSEFCHCVQHLRFAPKSAFLRRMKKRHIAHHFHSEKGNFGITNFLWDRILGTFYADPKNIARSDTVNNLGYAGQEMVRFPWVAELSGLTPQVDRGQEREAGK